MYMYVYMYQYVYSCIYVRPGPALQYSLDFLQPTKTKHHRWGDVCDPTSRRKLEGNWLGLPQQHHCCRGSAASTLVAVQGEQRQWEWEQWDGTVGGWDSNPRCSVKRVQHHWLRSVSHCFTTQDWYPYGFMRQTVENNLMGFPKMGILSKWQCWTSKKWWWTIRGALEF